MAYTQTPSDVHNTVVATWISAVEAKNARLQTIALTAAVYEQAGCPAAAALFRSSLNPILRVNLTEAMVWRVIDLADRLYHAEYNEWQALPVLDLATLIPNDL